MYSRLPGYLSAAQSGLLAWIHRMNSDDRFLAAVLEADIGDDGGRSFPAA